MSSQEQQTTGYKRRSSGKRRRTGTTPETAAVENVASAGSASKETAATAEASVMSTSTPSRETRADAKARAIAEAEAEKGSTSLVGRVVNTGRFDGIRKFIRDTLSEIRKVIWPDRETTRNLTLLVIALSLVLGLLLGGIDYILFELFEALP